MTDTASADETSSIRMRAYAVMVFAPLFFCSNLIIGRAANEAVLPNTLAFWRWFIAFAILLPFALPGIRRHFTALRTHAGELFLLGFLGMVVCGSLIYVSLHHTTATNATLIYTSSPVLIVLLEWLFRGIRPSLRQTIGIALAFAGVAIIIMKGDLQRLLSFQFNFGDIGVAIGALAWACYSVLLKRAHFRALPTIALFCAIAFAGWVLLLPFMVWELVQFDAFPRSANAWWSILGVALIASVLAFSTFQYGVKILGPSVAGIFMYLLPIYGVSLAVIFLGEQLQTFHLAGFLCVAAGVALATLPSRLMR